MPRSFLTPVLKRAFSVALLTAASISNAETHTLNLLGDPSNITIYNGNYVFPPNLPYTSGQLNLSDASTGLNSLPGFSFNIGDSINGTMTFSQSLIVPAGANSYLTVNIGWLAEGTNEVRYSDSSVVFFDGGTQVSPSSNFQLFTGSGGVLSIGGLTTANSAPRFQFDRVVFNATVNQIIDGSGQSTTSGSTLAGTPWFRYEVTSPVPEPTSALLLMFGIGFLVFARKVTTCSSDASIRP